MKKKSKYLNSLENRKLKTQINAYIFKGLLEAACDSRAQWWQDRSLGGRQGTRTLAVLLSGSYDINSSIRHMCKVI